MLVYRGKLDWFDNAVNDGITIIFPGPNFEVGSPAIAAWQWTVDDSSNPKKNVFDRGVIDSVVITETGQRQVYFNQGNYYRFKAVFSDDMKSITVVMSNPLSQQSDPKVLNVHYNHASSTMGARYFVGKMNWVDYAKNEMFMVIFPSGFDLGDAVIAYWQWTIDSKGQKKGNVNFEDSIHTKKQSTDGTIVTFGADATTYYTFTGTISKDEKTCTVYMKNPSEIEYGPFVLDLQA